MWSPDGDSSTKICIIGPKTECNRRERQTMGTSWCHPTGLSLLVSPCPL